MHAPLAQALLLYRQSPNKGMPHKNVPRKVTQFWFSHCTLRIVRMLCCPHAPMPQP